MAGKTGPAADAGYYPPWIAMADSAWQSPRRALAKAAKGAFSSQPTQRQEAHRMARQIALMVESPLKPPLQ